MATNRDTQLAEFLDKALPECMEQCAHFTKQIIAQGHQELQPHLLEKCTNVDADKLSQVCRSCVSSHA